MREIAILGPTASGKTKLSIELAKELNANILSLDSLSIYNEIDIASAKPTPKERDGIKHFGIDALQVDDNFNVTLFFELYKKAKQDSYKNQKNLIIVGGTGFYLKSMIDGLSYRPNISKKTKLRVEDSLSLGYKLMKEFDKDYSCKISENDSYRIEKWLEIYFETGEIPSQFFSKNKKEPIIDNIEIYEIEVNKENLREKIDIRTQMMINAGLIDEVFYLEKKFTRTPNPMKAIGIIETLSFLDGNLNQQELKEKIVTNTTRLAKRQKTFNNSQFKKHIQDTPQNIKEFILSIG